MAQPHQGQRRPWNPFTYWPCWILKLHGLKSGWYVLQDMCFLIWADFCIHYCVHVLLIVYFSLVHVLCIIYSLLSWSGSLSLPQHGYYSRTVVLRLLERKYKSLVSDLILGQYLSQTPVYFWHVWHHRETSMKSLFRRHTNPQHNLGTKTIAPVECIQERQNELAKGRDLEQIQICLQANRTAKVQIQLLFQADDDLFPAGNVFDYCILHTAEFALLVLTLTVPDIL